MTKRAYAELHVSWICLPKAMSKDRIVTTLEGIIFKTQKCFKAKVAEERTLHC